MLNVRADGTTIIGPPGPVTIDGVVAGGSSGGSYTPGHRPEPHRRHPRTTRQINFPHQVTAGNAGQVTNTGGGTYDLATTTAQSTYVPGTSTPAQTTFVPPPRHRLKRSYQHLLFQGAGVGVHRPWRPTC